MTIDSPLTLTDPQEELLLVLATEEARSIPAGPVGVGHLAPLCELSEKSCWKLLQELRGLGLVTIHDFGPGKSLLNAASLTDFGKKAAFDRALVEPKGPVVEFTERLPPLQLKVLDVVVEQESRNAGAAPTRSHVRSAIRKDAEPPLSLDEASAAIDALVGPFLAASGGREPSYQVTVLGMLASKWGSNTLEIMDGMLGLLRELLKNDPGLSRYSWTTARRGLGLPRKAANLFYISVTRAGLGNGIFKSEGEDWWTTPSELDVLLEENPTATDHVRKLTAKTTGRTAHVESNSRGPAPDETERGETTTMALVKADPKKVFVIHGRNLEARKQMGVFLRACGLVPINFEDLRAEMGGTPTIADIVERGMSQAQGVVALFTEDEYAGLRPEFRRKHEKPDEVARWQGRPNVIFEAGMAFGKDRTRVVFVLLGNPVLFTDVSGIHMLRPTNSAQGDRTVLRETLRKGMQCDVEDSTDWMSHGDFETCIRGLSEVSPRDPFSELVAAPADVAHATAVPASVHRAAVMTVAPGNTMPYEELLLAAQSVKNMLGARAVGKGADDREYQELRQRLLDYPSVKSKLSECVLTCRSLDEFWAFIQPKFKGYAERRDYLRKEFEPVLAMLEAKRSGAA